MVIIENIGASVLARLKNEAKKQNISFQQILILFAQEELLRKISDSSFKDNFILKGGLLIYSLSGFSARPTIDSDYLVDGLNTSDNSFNDIVTEIIDVDTGNNFIDFEIKDFEIITEQDKYSGKRVNLISKIRNTRTHIHLDFGVGDTVSPPARKIKLPVILLEFEKPEVYVYSIESVIAEKTDAIIMRMETTSRMKDFYDIYYLALNYNFSISDLSDSLYNTFKNRSTNYQINSIEEIERLASDKILLRRWSNFCERVLDEKIDFKDVIEVIISFLNPPFKEIFKDNKSEKTWDFKKQKYL